MAGKMAAMMAAKLVVLTDYLKADCSVELLEMMMVVTRADYLVHN